MRSRVYRNNYTTLLFFLLLTLVASFVTIEAQTKKKPAIKKAPPKVRYYSVPAGEKVRVRLETTLNSKNAHIGQTFRSKTVEPVYSSNGVEVIPQGSTIVGQIINAQPAKKGGKPGTIDVSFTSLKLPNGRTAAINGSLASFEEGGTTGNEEGTVSGKKTKNRKLKFIGGGAAGGAVIGGLAGGGTGALIGGVVGAGTGAIGGRLTKGKNAEVKEGTEFGVYLNRGISLPEYKAN
jgi:hypothetical protein